MRISPINTFKSNISLKGKTFTPKTSTVSAIKRQTEQQQRKTITKDIPLETIQAINGFGPSKGKTLSVDELADYVEHYINTNLEEKLLEYHKTVLKASEIHRFSTSFEFRDEKGRKYSALHNFPSGGKSFFTIQVEQNYDGIPYDSKVHYMGYPYGKLPNPNHQTGFIFPRTNAGEIEYIDYELRDYNIDDEHGYTDATISKDGTIKKITTGYDMLVSPIRIQYNYENGVLKSAHFRTYDYNNKYKYREAICTFDKNRRIKEIHYPKKTDKDGEILPEKTCVRNNSGKFVSLQNV